MISSAVEIRGLSVVRRARAQDIVLVEDVSFDLEPREIVGIVGETGAGKTLTVRAMTGLLPRGLRAAGVVRMGADADIDLASDTAVASVRGRGFGVVLQNPVGMFDPLMRIKRQVVEGVVLRRLLSPGAAIERAGELLQSMGFEDPDSILDLYPHQLSGGMSQRVAIAMALMPKPKVIVADEPTTALDANLRLEVLALFRLVASDHGAAVILVSHDLGLVSRVCDRVIVMYAGRILEEGPTDEVLRTPQHPYTAALLRSSPTLDARPQTTLPVIGGQPPEPTNWPPACVFEPRCQYSFELCRAERPILRSVEARSAACHLAFEGRTFGSQT